MTAHPQSQALRAYQPVAPEKRLFPLCHYTALNVKGKALGKTPRQKHWTKEEHDHDEMVAHMEDGSNVAFRLGNGWAVVDWDSRRDPAVQALVESRMSLSDAVRQCEASGTRSIDQLFRDVGLKLDTTFRGDTGGHGLHVYVRIPQTFRGREQVPEYPGIEFKHSARRYVVAFGSIHPGDAELGIPPGRPYVLRAGSPPLDQTPEATAALLEAFKHLAPPDHARGTGENTFGNFAGKLKDAFLSRIPAEKFGRGADPSWLDIMMSAHWASGGQDREDFVDWCIGDPLYADHADEVRKRWDSCTPRVDSIKTGLLFKMLAREGVPSAEMPTESASVQFADMLTADELEGDALPPGVERFGHLKSYTFDALRKEIGEEPPFLDGFFHARPGSIYVVYGPAGHGKTQGMTSLSASVAHGDREWMGRRLFLQGPVLWFALDDEDSLLKSDLAWLARTKNAAPDIRIICDDPGFETEASWKVIEAACQGRRLVVIDTLATALPKGDPDKSNFVGDFYTRLKAVGRRTGSTFILLHHTPKDDPTKARNAGSIVGNANGSVNIHKPDGDDGLFSEMRGMKVRGERAEPIHFTVESVPIGYDARYGRTKTGGFAVSIDPKEIKADKSIMAIANCVINRGDYRAPGEYVMTLKRLREKNMRGRKDDALFKNWGETVVGPDFEMDYVIPDRENAPHLVVVRTSRPRRDAWTADDMPSPDELQAQDELTALKAEPDFSGLV